MNFFPKNKRLCINVTRVCFSAVFVMNIICAFQFILFPDSFAPSYELAGRSGQAAIQGIGVAFLMWNTTYPAFIFNPSKYSILGIVILIQQIIGLLGESLIASTLSSDHFMLIESITRFIIFDGVGLIVMMLGYLILRKIVQ